MKSKVLIIFSLYFFFGFYTSCCKVKYDYFNFSALEITAIEIIDEYGQKQGVSFEIVLDSIDYVAYNYNFEVFNTAYAMSRCPKNGYKGLKKTISQFNLTCNLPYFDTIPAGESLNKIIIVDQKIDSSKVIDFAKLFNDNITKNRVEANTHLPKLIVNKNNLTDTIHIFTFEFIKSNGEIVKEISTIDNW